VRAVEFESATTPIILAIISGEKEKVALNDFAVVDPRGKNVEVWMTEVEQAMCRSMRTVMKASVDEYIVVPRTQWVQNWPGQCVLNASQLHWTREMEDFIREKGNDGVKAYYEQQVNQLKDMVVLIRGRLNALARITLGSLTVIDVHARDVTKKMWASGVASSNDFDWISQLRYYWIDSPSVDGVEGNMSVSMISSRRPYGYEYLGNTLRLVITPLTDKCAWRARPPASAPLAAISRDRAPRPATPQAT
jgi:dynein heavy chain